MLNKIKEIIEKIQKYRELKSTSKCNITPKGQCLLAYLENKINGVEQDEIEAYEKFLDGKDLNLYYEMLKITN